MPKILVVDDELSIRESFKLILEDKYDLLLAASGEAALKTIVDQQVDLVFLDIRMPGLNGLEALQKLRQLDPGVEIIMVTAVNDVRKASEAIKFGARDYLIKPFDVDQILKITEQTLRKKAILAEGSRLRLGVDQPTELIGQHAKIVAVNQALHRLKRTTRVLIIGEPGTEKEAAARLLHQGEGPFVSLALARSLSPAKMQRLIFGQEKGERTATLQAELGALEAAQTGTLFLNNLDALPAELLKKLQAKDYTRLGGSAKLPLTARLIGGASQALDFAEAVIKLPPLRERPSDIPLLVNFFLEKYNWQYAKEIKLDAQTMAALSNYLWPGNVTELKLTIKRLVLTAPEVTVGVESLPLDILIKTTPGAGADFVDRFEKAYVRRTLVLNDGNKTAAAAFLGITQSVLETKI